MAIPNSKLDNSPSDDIRMEQLESLRYREGVTRSSDLHLRSAGRYCVAVDFHEPDDSPMALRLLDEENNAFAYDEATVALIRGHVYSNFVFQTTRPQVVCVEIVFGGDQPVKLRGVRVDRICLADPK